MVPCRTRPRQWFRPTWVGFLETQVSGQPKPIHNNKSTWNHSLNLTASHHQPLSCFDRIFFHLKLHRMFQEVARAPGIMCNFLSVPGDWVGVTRQQIHLIITIIIIHLRHYNHHHHHYSSHPGLENHVSPVAFDPAIVWIEVFVW